MTIRLNGSTSGYVEIDAPSIANNNTLTLPSFGFGKVLQVVQYTHNTQVTTSSTSYVTTGLTGSITPSSSTSKVFIFVTMPCRKQTDNIFSGVAIGLFRGTVSGTKINEQLFYAAGANAAGSISMAYLDSPNTSSSQTYTVGVTTGSSLTTVDSCSDGRGSTLVLVEVAA